jgi:hypothetical protein
MKDCADGLNQCSEWRLGGEDDFVNPTKKFQVPTDFIPEKHHWIRLKLDRGKRRIHIQVSFPQLHLIRNPPKPREPAKPAKPTTNPPNIQHINDR